MNSFHALQLGNGLDPPAFTQPSFRQRSKCINGFEGRLEMH